MRSVINISLPPKLAKMIKNEVKEGGYASVSEFIRHLVRLWHTQQLTNDLRSSEKDIAKGKVTQIKSLDDLMK
jgi:putative addiction module CopG family antidote